MTKKDMIEIIRAKEAILAKEVDETAKWPGIGSKAHTIALAEWDAVYQLAHLLEITLLPT